MNILLKQDWPGNVRMLKNVIEKTVIFARNPLIRAEQIAFALKSDSGVEIDLKQNVNIQEFMEMKEKEFIERALILAEGKKQVVAETIGIDRATLWRKIQKYKIIIEETH